MGRFFCWFRVTFSALFAYNYLLINQFKPSKMKNQELAKYEREIRDFAIYYYRVFKWHPIRAIRAGINLYKVRHALDTQPLSYFEFKKLNGQMRSVMATKDLVYIPREDHPNGRGGGYTSHQIRFYDTTIQEWRSCLADRIIRVYF